MASVNKVILIGNLGRDPEKRQTSSGTTVCNITMATSRQWKDRATGDRQEETEWHRVVLYDRLGDIAAEYLKKGRSVYIEGRLKTRKWTDKGGADRYTTEIIAEQMQMLGGRDGGDGGSGGYGGSASRGQAPAVHDAASAAREAPAAKTPAAGGTGFDDMDDDIPF